MKKTICLILIAALALSLGACSIGDKGVKMTATIVELGDGTALVEPAQGDAARASSDRISFSTAGLDDIGAAVGDTVSVTYSGEIMESYPAQINPLSWRIVEKAGAE